MAEGSEEAGMAEKLQIIGPDLFGFYKQEVINLLTQDDNFPFSTSTRSKQAAKSSSSSSSSLPKLLVNPNTPSSSSSSSSSSLFSNIFQDTVSLSKTDLLKASLCQTVTALTQEVDEMIDPVIRIRHVLDCLSSKINQSSDGEALVIRDLDSTSSPRKKQKMWYLNGKEDLLAERSKDAEKEIAEDNEDLKLLLGSEYSVVEGIIAKQSDEHYVMLKRMEQQLEELLGAVASKCRLMTLQEKQQLRKLIQELPTRNLDRIVEIVYRLKSADTLSYDEIVVDLEKQDNATLWRLYFYTRAVENARKLSA